MGFVFSKRSSSWTSNAGEQSVDGFLAVWAADLVEDQNPNHQLFQGAGAVAASEVDFDLSVEAGAALEAGLAEVEAAMVAGFLTVSPIVVTQAEAVEVGSEEAMMEEVLVEVGLVLAMTVMVAEAGLLDLEGTAVLTVAIGE